MSQDSVQPPFDDPALKAALRRSLGMERAPASLMERIRASAAGEQERVIPLFRRPFFRQAIAAVLLVGLSVALVIVWRSNRKDPYAEAYAIPNSLYKAMVNQHEERGAQVEKDAVTQLASATQLAKQLGRGILAPDLTQDGWTFEGGAIRTWASGQVAQLYFSKGQARISVLSMPASVAASAKEGYTYQTTFSGTPIAGVVKEGGLHCLIGSDQGQSLNAGDLSVLLNQHVGEIVRG